MKTFAKKLQAWRGKRAQPEAAAVLGVPLRTYQNWEQGHRTPSPLVRAMLVASIISRAMDRAEKKAGQRSTSSNPKSGSAAARAARPARRTGRKG